MAISELIKYEGDNDTFVWKYPHEDFNNMTELVVHESQEAVFFANGVAADSFGPGRYKLDAPNIPILTKLLNLVTGVSVFHCEVFFLNKTVQMAVKWGTDSKIRFIEPILGVPVEIGASGQMNLALSDGRKMLIKLVGTMRGISWDNENHEFAKSLAQSFRPLINTAVKSNLPVLIRQNNIDIVEIDEHLDELSQALKEKLLPEFEEYGLTIPQFYITNIVLPEDDENYQQLKSLHTVLLQKRLNSAEAEVKTVQAHNRAMYETAEADTDAKVASAQRNAILEKQTTETEIAKREAERKIIQAQTDAQTARVKGLTEAEVMKAQGYNQKDVINADVQKAYAEGIGNMGSGISTGGGNTASDLLGLGVGIAAAGKMAPQINKVLNNINNEPDAQDSSDVQDKQTIKCPNCGAIIPASAKFCLNCGAKIQQESANTIICPNCGKRVAKGKFCSECGASLDK